jgi:hypothetical protein
LVSWVHCLPIVCCAWISFVLLVLSPSGAGALPPSPEAAEQACTNCHPGSSAAPGAFESTASTGHYWLSIPCTDCHDSHGGTNNLHLVREVIDTWYSGFRDVTFITYHGPNSYADGDTVYDGVCEVCHTETVYHRNNPSGDHTHNAGTKCTGCHVHDYSFAPVHVGVPDDGARGPVARAFPVPSRGAVSVILPSSSGAGPEAVNITVFNASGQRVRTLEQTPVHGGRVSWDGLSDAGSRVEPGVYFLRVRGGESVWTGKAVLLP